ncbi:T1SS-143 repeat domain-containing protein [Roseibium aggregatum]|uniref:T1SS-143 repeat domain-containing protein n=1 Tax=Roseibium aggregatum TaxID=187304 RepID=UPI0006E32411|nr:tandem-95 repeat protein [Roseibium aggregatum]
MNADISFIRIGDDLQMIFADGGMLIVQDFFLGDSGSQVALVGEAQALSIGEFVSVANLQTADEIQTAAAETANLATALGGPQGSGQNFQNTNIEGLDGGSNLLDLLTGEGPGAGASVFGEFTDGEVDTVPTASGATAGAVDEGYLNDGNEAGEGPLVAIGDLGIDFGENAGPSLSLVFNTNSVGVPLDAAGNLLELSSDGVALAYTITDNADGGQTLTAAKVGTGEVVFTVTLDIQPGTQTGGAAGAQYIFTLFGNLDHVTPETDLALPISFGITASDSDGDEVGTTFLVTVGDDDAEIGAADATSVDEDGLTDGNPDSGYQSDLAGAETTANGSLAISWGADDANPTDGGGLGDRFVVFSDAQPGLAGLTSNGSDINISILADGTLVGFIGSNTPSSAQADNVIFFATVSDGGSGSYEFTLVESLDHPETGVEDDIVLTFAFTATDGDGDATSSTFEVTVNDDAPVVGDVLFSQVDEDGLEGGNVGESYPENPGDYATGGARDDATTSGRSLNISWGADDGNRDVDGGASSGNGDRAVVFANSVVAVSRGATELGGVTSRGETVEFRLDDDGATLVGHVTGDNARDVFRVRLSDADNGSYDFELLDVLDHLGAGKEDNIVLTFEFTAMDSDGDSAGGSFSVRIDDDAPVASGVVAGAVLDDEAQTEFGAGNNGAGPFLGWTDASPNVKTVSGVADSLFQVGADGFAGITLDAAPAFNVVYMDTDGFAQVESVQWTAGSTDANGTTTWTAYSTNYAEADGGAAVLVIHADGSYTFTMKAPVAHEFAVPGYEEDAELEFSFTVRDGDGDTASGSLSVSVDDDTPEPVVSVVVAASVLDDEGQTEFTPSNPGGVRGDAAGEETSVSGVAGTLFSMGADGLGTVEVSLPDFEVVFEDDNGFAQIEAVSWGAGVRSAGGLTTWTATSEHYPDGAAVLVVGADGSYTFTMSAPIAHDRSSSREDDAGLRIGYVVTDGDGDGAAGLLRIQVDDDTPVAFEVIASDQTDDEGKGDFAADSNAGAADPSGDFDDADGEITGAAGALFNAGADGVRSVVMTSLPVLSAIYDAGAGVATIETVSWSSQTTNGGTTVWTAIGDDSGDTVATLTIGNDGSYSFVQSAPLVHGSNDPQENDDLDLTFEFRVTDGDGDRANGSLTVTVDDDTPVASGVVAGAVLDDEAQTEFGAGNNGAGPFLGWTDASPNVKTVSGVADSLFQVGADGFAGITLDAAPAFNVVYMDTDGFAQVESVQWTAGSTDANGTTTWTAYSTNYAEADGGAAVLVIHADGSYTFTMKAPVAHEFAVPGYEEDAELEFSFTVRDGDGDTASGSLSVSVDDDTPEPVVSVVVAASVLDDEGQTEFTPSNPGGVRGDAAGEETSVSGVAGTLFSMGADGLGTVEVSLPDFEVVFEDDNGFAQIEAVSWGAGVRSAGGLTTWTATSEHYPDGAAVLVVGADGSYTFTMSAPIAHDRSSSREDDAGLRIGYVVTDGDGDGAAGLLRIQVDDDTPVAFEVIASDQTDDEGKGDFAADSNAGAADPSGDFDDADGEITGAAGALFNAGADGVRSVVMTSLPVLSAIYDAGAGVATIETVSWSSQTTNGGTTVWTAIGDDSGDTVATLTIGNDGSYSFVQSAPLVHGSNDPQENDDLDLTFEFRVTDGDGDRANGSLTVTVDDDTPVVAPYEVNTMRIISDDETVKDINGNPIGNAGDGSNPDSAGTDSGEYNKSKSLVFDAGADGGTVAWNTANSSVDGGAENIRFEVDGTTGTLYILQTQGAAGEVRIAEITLNEVTGKYTYTQVANLLHDNTPANTENEAEFTLAFTVTDGDGDEADGYVKLLIDDDTPVIGSTDASVVDEAGVQSVAGSDADFAVTIDGTDYTFSVMEGAAFLTVTGGSLTDTEVTLSVLMDVFNGSLHATGDFSVDDPGANVGINEAQTRVTVGGQDTGGNYQFDFASPADAVAFEAFLETMKSNGLLNEVFQDGGRVTQTGSLDISWGADDGDAGNNNFNQDTPGGFGNRSVTFTSTTAGNNVVDGNGDPLTLTSGGTALSYALNANGTVLTASANGQTIFRVALDDDGSGAYQFRLEGPLDHVPDLGALDLNFTFTATDGDGDTAGSTFQVTVNDDTVTIGTVESGAVSEDTSGAAGAESFVQDTATGSLGIDWGADGSDSDTGSQPGDRSVVFNPALDGFTSPLTADGDAITYSFNSDGTVLTATADAGGVNERAVFTVTLSDTGSGSYTFDLLDNLDHDGTRGRGENFSLAFGFTATDSDGDTATGSINVTVNDDGDRPSIGSTDASVVDEAGVQSVAGSDADFAVTIDGTDYTFSVMEGAAFLTVTGGSLTDTEVTLSVLMDVFNGSLHATGDFSVDDPGANVGINEAQTRVTVGGQDTGGNYQFDFASPADAVAFEAFLETMKSNGLLNEVFQDGGRVTQTGSLDISWGADDGDAGNNNFNQDTPGGFGNRSVTFTSTTAGNNVVDGNGDPLTLTSGGTALSYALNANGTVLTASANGQTIFRVALDDDGSGAYQFRLEGPLDHVPDLGALDLNFTFTAMDGDGDTAGSTFQVTVNDDVAEAGNDTSSTDEDTPLVINAFRNDDTGADGVDFDNTPEQKVTFTDAVNGIVVYNGDGTFTYTPNANYNGSDSFTYTIEDGDGDTSTATIEITVNPVNDDPVAGGDNAITAEDMPVTVDVLDNDTDVDGDALFIDSFTQAGHGTVTLDDKGTPSSDDDELVYTPDADFFGSDSFSYTVSDGNGGTDTQTVQVEVTAVNDAPVANADTLTSIAEDSGTRVITFAELLNNDSAGPTNENSQTLSITGLSNIVGGSATIVGNTVEFTPDDNFNGTASFDYTVSDNGLTNGVDDFKSDVGTATFEVIAVNDPAIIGGVSTGSVTEDVNVSGGYLQETGSLTISDVDGVSEQSFQAGTTSTLSNGNPALGSLTIDANGNWTYKIDNSLSVVQDLDTNESFTESFTVRSSDGTSKTVSVDVNGASDSSTKLWIQIAQPNHSGSSYDTTGYEDLRVWINGNSYAAHLNPGHSAGETGQPSDFFLTGSGARYAWLSINNAPTSGLMTLRFNYTAYDGPGGSGVDNGEGPVFRISTTSSGGSIFANYQYNGRYTGNYSDASNTVRQITFDYSVIGSSVSVSNLRDPIALDLNDDGVDLSATVAFDIDADGDLEQIGWAGSEDGLLVMDLDGSGAIENGSELFSEVFNGGAFANSLEALASLDANGDGVIDAQDAAFDQIKVWQDANSDGIVQEGELLSLIERGIEAINLEAAAVNQEVDGNSVFAEGTYTKSDGSTGTYVGVNLAAANDDTDDSDDTTRQSVALSAGVGLILYAASAEEVAAGLAEIRINGQPQSGDVTVSEDFTVTYEAFAGFSGEDSTEIQLVFTDGSIVTRSIELEVLAEDAPVSVVSETTETTLANATDESEFASASAGVQEQSPELSAAVTSSLITGDDGNNVLVGTEGDDILAGGLGSDLLTGGGGADTFVLSSLADADIITDYSFDEGDRLDIGALLDGAFGSGSNETEFVRAVAEADGSVKVAVDIDGTGAAHDWQDVAMLQDHASMGDTIRVVMDQDGHEVNVAVSVA